jgi:hypothetical protein
LVYFDGDNIYRNASSGSSFVHRNFTDPSRLTYEFNQGIKKAGNYLIKVANRLERDSKNYRVEVLPSEISHEGTRFEVLAPSDHLVAGQET